MSNSIKMILKPGKWKLDFINKETKEVLMFIGIFEVENKDSHLNIVVPKELEERKDVGLKAMRIR